MYNSQSQRISGYRRCGKMFTGVLDQGLQERGAVTMKVPCRTRSSAAVNVYFQSAPIYLQYAASRYFMEGAYFKARPDVL